MEIKKADHFIPAHKTSHLVNMTKKKIDKILGFNGTNPSADGKCKFQWDFVIDGQDFAIWDYKGSAGRGEFSCYGAQSVLATLFGENWRADF